jgi:serine/threonine protein kinase
MSASDIIHGDIKPENVLIFKDDTGAYTAKVIDFEYSTRFAHEDDLISLPASWPWKAPEHESNRFMPAQARKMDVFSFGMLCLWVMFEKYLSRTVPLPKELLWVEQYFQIGEEKCLSKSVLDSLKHEDKLVLLAQQLVLAEQGLDDNKKQALQQFFDVSLVCEPHMRGEDLKQSFGYLMLDR